MQFAVSSRGSLDHFTDREVEKAAYRELWSPGGGSRILSFGGMSGNGKSTLLLYLAARETPADCPAVLLDLDRGELHQECAFLERLADELARHVRSLDLNKFHQAVAKAEEGAESIHLTVRVSQTASNGGQIGGSPITIQVTEVEADINRRLSDHWRRARRHLTRELMEALQYARRRTPKLGWALLVDTYEAVSYAANPDFQNWFEGEFLPTLVRDDSQVRVIVAGREGLPAGEWSVPRSLVEWKRSDSDQFLGSWGLDDQDLRAAIFDHCHGHPLTTDLARLVWAEGLTSGQPLHPGDLRRFTNQRAALKWLMTRFIERLPAHLKEAVLAASHFRQLSVEGLNAVLPPNGHLDSEQFYRLCNLSFIQVVPGLTRAHDLIREVEQARRREDEPDAYRRLHVAAMAYFASKDDRLNALYHRFAIDLDGAISEWIGTIDAALTRYNRAGQGGLLKLLTLPERWATLDTKARGLHALYRGLLANQEELLDEAGSAFKDAGDHFLHVDGYWGKWGRATTQKALGLLYVRTDRLTEAETAYQKALPIYRDIEERLGEANTQEALGLLYVRTNRLTEAETAYQTALPIFRDIESRLGEANTQQALGRLYVRTDRLTEAETAYQTALLIFCDVESRLGEANTQQALGRLYVRTNRLKEAQTAYQTALPIYRDIEDRLGEANIQEALGDLYMRTDRLKEAQTAYQTALPIFRDVEFRIGEANTQQALGDLYVRTARITEAESVYQTALSIYRDIEGRLGEANTQKALGLLYVRTHRLTEAETAYQTALPIFRDIEERLGEANTQRTLGDLYVRTDRLTEAETAYQMALTIYRNIEERLGEANTQQVLGRLYVRTHRLTEAETAYQTALLIYREVEERLGEANTQKALGDLYMQTDRLTEAETAYQTALPIYRDVEEQIGEANTQRSLGKLHAAMMDLAASEEAFTTALRLYEDICEDYSIVVTHLDRGQCRLNSGVADSGGNDWGIALTGALAVEPDHLASQVINIMVQDMRSRCLATESDRLLCIALESLINAASLRASQVVLGDRESATLRLVLTVFQMIREIAAYHESSADNSDGTGMLIQQRAAEIDQFTSRVFGLTELVTQRFPPPGR